MATVMDYFGTENTEEPEEPAKPKAPKEPKAAKAKAPKEPKAAKAKAPKEPKAAKAKEPKVEQTRASKTVEESPETKKQEAPLDARGVPGEDPTRRVLLELVPRLDEISRHVFDSLGVVLALCARAREIQARPLHSEEDRAWVQATSEGMGTLESLDDLAQDLDNLSPAQWKARVSWENFGDVVLENPERVDVLSEDLVRFAEGLHVELGADPVDGLAVAVSRSGPLRLPNAWTLPPEELAARLLEVFS